MSDQQTPWGTYGKIAEELRRRLAAGDPTPGSFLPSESTLSKEFGVSRNTLRRALSAIEADGLIDIVPGRGRLVRRPGEQPVTRLLPQYRQIAEELRSAIERGEFKPGDPVPSEAAIMIRHKVSRGTARQAFAELEGAGIVESIHGKGRFVRQR